MLNNYFKAKMVPLSVIVVAAIGMVSCSDLEIEKDNLDFDVYKNPTFVVGEDAATYTSVGGNYQILWQEHDQIGVFCSNTQPETINEVAVLHSPYAGQNRGVFKSDINWGTDRHKFFVYYPWRKEQSTSAATLRHSIGRLQAQNGGNNSTHIGKNAFMHARSNSVLSSTGEISLDFTHTTCILELSFKSTHAAVLGKPLTKIVFKADNGATLSGDFTIDITGSTVKPTFTSGCDSVVLTLENAIMPNNSTDSLKAYLVVNPALMTTATIHYTVDGVEYTLTKSINKTLEPQKVYQIKTDVDYGTISASPSVIYLSPTHPLQAVTVASTHAWSFVESCGVAGASSTEGGIGSTSITFTRKTSPIDYTVYGNNIVTLKTTGENPKYSTIKVANLHIDVPDTLYIGNPVGADTIVYIPDLVPFGGDSRLVVESYTGSWIQSMVFDPVSGKIKAKVSHNNTNTDRPGSITVYHENDPTYKVTVPILQNEFIYVPEFKYFVVDIQWCNRPSLDVDIAFMFENNGFVVDGVTRYPPFEHMPLGYGPLYSDVNLVNQPSNWSSLYVGSASGTTGRYVKYDSKFYGGDINLLNWGGDAVDGQGETVYFDAESFNNATDVPRYLNLGLYVTWWSHGHAEEPWTVRAKLNCYKGGIMEKYATNSSLAATTYRNVGGTLVHSQQFFIELKHSTFTTPSLFMTNFTYAAKIRYDRITHYGIMRESEPSAPKWSADRPLCINGADLYNSSPLTKDELERYRLAKDKIASQLFVK